jgi:hypothetical protein
LHFSNARRQISAQICIIKIGFVEHDDRPCSALFSCHKIAFHLARLNRRISLPRIYPTLPVADGALLYRADAGGLPVVGDWVAVRQYAPADVAIITEVLPRRTKFSRKSSGSTQQEQVIAANIDLLFTVCGLGP